MNTEHNMKQLFEQYADMVYRIALSYCGSVSHAEDIVQDVFLRCLRKSPHFENSAHEKAWFIRVTINCCKSLAASAWIKKICPLDEADQYVSQFSISPPEQDLLELLSELPSKYRIVLILRYYEEYSVQEIAKLLDITPNLVSARLLRAKKLLKQKLLTELGGYSDETRTI